MTDVKKSISATNSNCRETNEDFLKYERENFYETIDNHNKTDNDGDEIVDTTNDRLMLITNENIYENLKIDGNSEKNIVDEEKEAELNVHMPLQMVQINEPLQETSEIIATRDVFNYRIEDEDQSDLIDENDSNDEIKESAAEDMAQSIKSRMFLSTDDTSCLLFTQTVTSPMLTPSEENIDFLKAFKCQSNQDVTTISDNTSQKTDDDQDVEELTESENLNVKLNGNLSCPQDGDNNTIIYEKVEQINQECLYDVPRRLGHQTDQSDKPKVEDEEIKENNYENVENMSKTMRTNEFDENYITSIKTTDYVVDKTSIETNDNVKATEVANQDDCYEETNNHNETLVPNDCLDQSMNNLEENSPDVVKAYENVECFNANVKTKPDLNETFESQNEKFRLSNIEMIKSQFTTNSATSSPTSTTSTKMKHTSDYKSFDITSQINKFENKNQCNNNVKEDVATTATTTNNCCELVSVLFFLFFF